MRRSPASGPFISEILGLVGRANQRRRVRRQTVVHRPREVQRTWSLPPFHTEGSHTQRKPALRRRRLGLTRGIMRERDTAGERHHFFGGRTLVQGARHKLAGTMSDQRARHWNAGEARRVRGRIHVPGLSQTGCTSEAGPRTVQVGPRFAHRAGLRGSRRGDPMSLAHDAPSSARAHPVARGHP